MGGEMSLCRHCGRTAGPDDAPYVVCDACANSPLCDRCGHERGDHASLAVEGETSCRGRLGDFQTLDLQACPCDGFQPIEGMIGDATFVQTEPDLPAGPSLRLA
jgi:hypothetical protein